MRRRRNSAAGQVGAAVAGSTVSAVAPLLPIVLLGLLGYAAWRKFMGAVNAWSGDPRDPIFPGAAAAAGKSCEELYGKEACDEYAAQYRAAGAAAGNPITGQPSGGPYLPPNAWNWDDASAPVPPDQKG